MVNDVYNILDGEITFVAQFQEKWTSACGMLLINDINKFDVSGRRIITEND